MSRKIQNQSFICQHCKAHIRPLTNGSYRNHCPFCLYSVHVDRQPGDRSETCHGLMKPIGINIHAKKGLQIKHECLKCGVQKVNKIAQNTIQADDYDLIISLCKSNSTSRKLF